jgi:hypothetical protein
MPTKLIRLEDGTLVEVEASPNEAQQISGGSAAQEVNANFDKIKPVLVNISHSITDVWKELKQLNKEITIEQAEVELGLSFELEGNVFVTKAKAGSNLTVKLVIKPKEDTK